MHGVNTDFLPLRLSYGRRQLTVEVPDLCIPWDPIIARLPPGSAKMGLAQGSAKMKVFMSLPGQKR
jgi:hypothetical protein